MPTVQGALGGPDLVRDRIVRHLRSARSDSISGIARELSRDRPKPLHRLTVAGYLAALTEQGVLRELERPPSKHYALANPAHHVDVYDRVARHGATVPDEGPRRGLAIAATLQAILDRPVFRSELLAAGATIDPLALPAATIADADRRHFLRLAQRRPGTGGPPPRGDPLYDLNDATTAAGTQWPSDAKRLLARVARDACNADALADDRPARDRAQGVLDDAWANGRANDAAGVGEGDALREAAS